MTSDWVKNNRKRVAELQREYYQRRIKENPNYNHEMNLAFRLRHPKRYLLHSAKARAKLKGWEFNLVESDFDIPECCPVLNIPLYVQSGKGKKPNSPLLDRIDNSRGYIKDNVRVISWRANDLLADGTIEEFEKIVDFLNAKKEA